MFSIVSIAAIAALTVAALALPGRWRRPRIIRRTRAQFPSKSDLKG
jgi:hypothetical protein